MLHFKLRCRIAKTHWINWSCGRINHVKVRYHRKGSWKVKTYDMDNSCCKLLYDGARYLFVLFTNNSDFRFYSFGRRNLERNSGICYIFGSSFGVHSIVDHSIFTGLAVLPSKSGGNIFGYWSFDIGNSFGCKLQSERGHSVSSCGCVNSETYVKNLDKLINNLKLIKISMNVCGSYSLKWV